MIDLIMSIITGLLEAILTRETDFAPPMGQECDGKLHIGWTTDTKTEFLNGVMVQSRICQHCKKRLRRITKPFQTGWEEDKSAGA